MPCDFAAVDDASETSLSVTAVETTTDSIPTPSAEIPGASKEFVLTPVPGKRKRKSNDRTQLQV